MTAPPHEATPPLDAGAAEHALRTLERELERGSVGGPPSDEALARWQRQAETLRDALEIATVPGRHRLLRAALRFLDDLEDMRQRKARYLARKEPARAPAFATEVSGWAAGLDAMPRQALAASIHAGLNPLPQAEVVLKPGAADAASPPDDQTTPAIDAAPVAPATGGDQVGKPEPLTAVEMAVAAADEPTVPFRDERAASSSRPVEPALSAPAARMSRRSDPIIAVAGRLARAGSFNDARTIALNWLRKKGFKVPPAHTDGFELRTSKGHTATSVSLPEKGVWALQAETVDSGFKGRRWRVEMVLLDVEPTPAVSVTLTAISPGGSPEPPTSVPQLVTRLVDGIGLLDANDGAALNAGPIWIRDQQSLQYALDSLRSTRRTRPLVVLSTYRKDDQSKQLLDPRGLSSKLGGLAQVFVLERDMAWPFNEAVGRDAAVAGASVRMFRPGFDPGDAPGRHPLWSPTELTAQGLDLNGLSHALLHEAAYLSLRALEREDSIPAFDRVRDMVHRRQIAEAREKAELASRQRVSDDDVVSLRAALESETELRRLFEEDNARLVDDLASIKAERSKLQDDMDTLRGRALHLEGRVQDLLEQLREARGSGEPSFPDSWDDLEGWCDAHLDGRVVLTKKALRSAKNSRYLDIPFAYRVLWFLAEQYVPARRNGGEEFKDGLAELGLDLSPVGRSASDHRSRETYSTDYKQERVNLDWHVKGSSDRDPRYGFRVYFHWHVRDQCVVVGSLPEHLDNVLT